MYQGKFDQKKKGSTLSVEEIVASRNSAAAKKEAPARQTVSEPASRKRPAAEQNVRKPVSAEVPAEKKAPKKAQKEVAAAPKRKGPRLGGVIFYTLYFLFIFLFFVAVYFGLQRLQDFLVEYEGAQPTAKSAEVFQQLFDDPDWGALYDAAGITDTQYEGKEAFVSYMEELVGDQELTYQLTSTGMSDDVKYFVKLGDKRLAYFTLTGGEKNTSFNFYELFEYLATPGSSSEIAEWKLGEVRLYYERANGYRIQTVDGHIPHVNGIALTDDHIIQVSGIKEDTTGFLPSGVTTPRTSIYEISDLIAEPVITVTDNTGAQKEVVYDEATDTFVEQAEDMAVISEEEKTLALDALKTYAKYGIREATTVELGKYFDSTGEAYKSIIKTDLTWTKGNNGISFDKDSVTGYCRYSDALYSCYVTTELTIKLTDGGTQTKSINATLLFSKTAGGWKVTKMTNANIAETEGKVRLTFMNDDFVLQSDFCNIEATTLNTPLLSVPDGKVFSGWMKETVAANGSTSMSLVFVPDENGVVTIPSGTTLEPMVLYPLFENAADVTEGA